MRIDTNKKSGTLERQRREVECDREFIIISTYTLKEEYTQKNNCHKIIEMKVKAKNGIRENMIRMEKRRERDYHRDCKDRNREEREEREE